MNSDELQQRLGEDSVFFNQLILPEWFSLKPSPFHGNVYRPLMDKRVKLLVVSIPRGFGKTTILQGFLMQQVLHLRHPVVVYISDTYTQAELHTETVRLELESNEQVIKLYGKQPGRKWKASLWTTQGGVSVVPKGSGQAIRGLKVGSSRPSLVIIDDPENDENIETKEQRDKLWKHLYAVIRPMLQAGTKQTKIVYLGTPLHEDCVLLRLIDLLSKKPFCDDSSIKVVELSAKDKFGESIWPELWTTGKLEEEEALYQAAGQLDVFYREYLGAVISSKDAEFPLERAAYYQEADLPDDLRTYGALDMAFSVNRGSDYSSIVVISVSNKTGGVYVRLAARGRMKPDKFLQRLQEVQQAFQPLRWFVQNVVLDEFFQFYASEKMLQEERICYLPFEKIKISRQKNAKLRRIAGLGPLYWTRRLQFLKGHTDLVSELAQNPRAKHDDLSDPLASMIQHVRIPSWLPRVVTSPAPGTLEAIEESLRRRRRGGRFGLTHIPSYSRGGALCH